MKAICCAALVVASGFWATQQHASAASFTCPKVRTISGEMGIRTRYISPSTDPTLSTLDPERVAQQASVRRDISYPAKKIVNLSILHANSGHKEQARAVEACLMEHVGSLKGMNYLQGSSESDMLYKSWMMSAIGLSVLRLKESGVAFEGEAAASYSEWAAMRGEEIAAFYRGHGCTNNHCYWAGVAAAATWRYTGRPELLDFARWTVLSAIAEATPEGDLPAELARGRLAVHYSAFAASALISSSALTGDESQSTRDFLRLVSRRACAAGLSVTSGTYDGTPQDLSGARPYLHVIGTYLDSECGTKGYGGSDIRTFFLGWDGDYMDRMIRYGGYRGSSTAPRPR